MHREGSDGAAMTLRQARARYFALNGFDESGYRDRWVKLMAGPLPIYLPNTAERVRSVRVHDLHHALTGYATTWTGEAEIGAWEIASDCADHYAAWILNFLAMAVGLFLAPTSVWRAFRRGRSSRNLYRAEFGDAMLDRSVTELRRELALDGDAAPPQAGDVVAFVLWSTVSLAVALAVASVLLMPIVSLSSRLLG